MPITKKRIRAGKKNFIKEQTVDRTYDAWQMRCQGHTVVTIGAKLGISYQAVQQLLAKAHTEFTITFSEEMKQEKDMAAQQYSWVMQESRDAWEASKGGLDFPNGDPKYLATFMTAAKAIREIYGLDDAIKIDNQETYSIFIPNLNSANQLSKPKLIDATKPKEEDNRIPETVVIS